MDSKWGVGLVVCVCLGLVEGATQPSREGWWTAGYDTFPHLFLASSACIPRARARTTSIPVPPAAVCALSARAASMRTRAWPGAP
jgi:hypothetical protein